MKPSNFILAGVLALFSINAIAQADDLLKEVKVSAASQEADIKNNQIIFNGPVEVTQGSIKILADKLRAFSRTTKSGKILVATGKPATYSQRLADGQPALASADEIRYDLSKKLLTLKGNASIDQNGSKVSGHQIRYNIELQQLVAESSGDGRVITIIQPENYQNERKSSAKKQPKPQGK